MDFSLVSTSIGLLTLLPLVAIYLWSANASPMGSLSLPCMTMMTSFIYFYFMPITALARGDEGYFGMYITDLTWTHFAVLLYALGAGAAFVAQSLMLNANPTPAYAGDRTLNRYIVWGLWGLAIGGVLVQFALGKLNLAADQEYQFAIEDVGNFAFITQAYNILVPMMLVLLVTEKFSLRSLLVLGFVMLVFLQAGFRFRIMILLAASATAFALSRGIKMRIVYGFVGITIGLVLVNVIGAIRHYGQGVDLSGLTSEKLDAMSGTFGGEFGIVYVLNYIADHPLPALSPLEPWVVGIARLVPSFIWADKPYPEYTRHFIDGATVANADKAGVAASQHVEILLQMGWFGLIPLAFLYYSIACWLQRRLGSRGRDVRIASCALIPSYFGFYMQTRGYFFQMMVDAIFMVGPLFLLTLGMKPDFANSTAPQARPHLHNRRINAPVQRRGT